MASEGQQPVWGVLKRDRPGDAQIRVAVALVPTDQTKTIRTEAEAEAAIARAPWRAVYTVTSDEGRAAISGIHLEPGDLTEPLSAQLARELVKPGEALAKARIGLLDMIEHDDPAEKEARAQWLTALHGLDAAELGTERRGKRQPDYLYAAIASRYLNAVASGSRRPVADTAWKLPAGYGPAFVRDALTRARKRKLLTWPAAPRQPGGQLTTRGQAVLAAEPPAGYGHVAPSVAPSAPRHPAERQKPPD